MRSFFHLEVNIINKQKPDWNMNSIKVPFDSFIGMFYCNPFDLNYFSFCRET
jgi:hypothetical protein